jgi:hypothetical protein
MTHQPDPADFEQQLDIAGLLVDRAIRTFFEGDDPLFVLALANPGHVLFHEIARITFDGNNSASRMVDSFRDLGVKTPSGKPVSAVSDLLAVLRRDANSLKHIGVAPGVSDASVIATLIVATIDAQDLRALSPTQLLFMAWAYASQSGPFDPAWDTAELLFDDLKEFDLAARKKCGLNRLDDPFIMESLWHAVRNAGMSARD